MYKDNIVTMYLECIALAVIWLVACFVAIVTQLIAYYIFTMYM